MEIGRGCLKLGEPEGLTVSREYAVAWKKQGLDIAELAFLRFELNLGSRSIVKRLGAPCPTVVAAIHRLERERGLR